MKTGMLLTAMMLVVVVSAYGADEKLKVETVSSAKVYVLYLTLATQPATYILEGVEAADFHGVKCLKGRFADISWMKGKLTYVPVENISAIVEYDSLEQYKEVIQKYSDKQMQ